MRFPHYVVSLRSPGVGSMAFGPARDQRQTDRDMRDAELLAKIKILFKASKKCYGSKRIHQDLLAEGDIVSERRVATT